MLEIPMWCSTVKAALLFLFTFRQQSYLTYIVAFVKFPIGPGGQNNGPGCSQARSLVTTL